MNLSLRAILSRIACEQEGVEPHVSVEPPAAVPSALRDWARARANVPNEALGELEQTTTVVVPIHLEQSERVRVPLPKGSFHCLRAVHLTVVAPPLRASKRVEMLTPPARRPSGLNAVSNVSDIEDAMESEPEEELAHDSGGDDQLEAAWVERLARACVVEAQMHGRQGPIGPSYNAMASEMLVCGDRDLRRYNEHCEAVGVPVDNDELFAWSRDQALCSRCTLELPILNDPKLPFLLLQPSDQSLELTFANVQNLICKRSAGDGSAIDWRAVDVFAVDSDSAVSLQSLQMELEFEFGTFSSTAWCVISCWASLEKTIPYHVPVANLHSITVLPKARSAKWTAPKASAITRVVCAVRRVSAAFCNYQFSFCPRIDRFTVKLGAHPPLAERNAAAAKIHAGVIEALSVKGSHGSSDGMHLDLTLFEDDEDEEESVVFVASESLQCELLALA